MAAKIKKRLTKNKNIFLELDKLQLKDVLCSICQSILIEPVTLPCFHGFCQTCFNGSIENNALCCPLCRLRIGSWLRTKTRQDNLVNIKLWKHIKHKFSIEIESKLKGETVDVLEDVPLPHISAPGEIRSEYEAELKRLREERLQLEEKHLKDTEFLIKKIQKEEEEAYNKYLERLREDELLAKQLDKNRSKHSDTLYKTSKTSTVTNVKSRLKSTKIDSYLAQQKTAVTKNSPDTIEDSTSTDGYTTACDKSHGSASPELVPNHDKYLKQLSITKTSDLCDKQNCDKRKNEFVSLRNNNRGESDNKNSIKGKNVQSLLVSLPYKGVIQQRIENRRKNKSVDSLCEELCYFKPIEEPTTTSFKANSGFPLHVPCVRPSSGNAPLQLENAPTYNQYIESLYRLRHISLERKLSSAFVILLKIGRTEKETSKCGINTRSRLRKETTSNSSNNATSKYAKEVVCNDDKQNIFDINTKRTLRRTGSTGCIMKDKNETTPKKTKIERKTVSDRKPHLRSDSKKMITISAGQPSKSSQIIETINNNNKIELAVKNLSSPLENCDVKLLMEEQMRIEKLIAQEKEDYEFARKMEAEWNGKRHPRRAAVKRQSLLTNTLRPAKKLKV